MSVQTACQIEVRRVREQDQPLLEQMYDALAPVEETLGLPPRQSAERRAWLAGLRQGINLVAFADGRLAGHLVLLAIDDAAEAMCFVHQDYRRQGIATALGREAVERARAAGYSRISVFINSHNVGARRGLLKFGFRPVWEDLEEAEYVYWLQGGTA
ncbi:MAG TPA: GNAT family N-acetyltransferase [Bryobacteraceae bacterium]|nr:GNAT family N-acetyltransferase [Bryobacteraceae bacterium]